jgi:hypothetical protein
MFMVSAAETNLLVSLDSDVTPSALLRSTVSTWRGAGTQ